MPCLVVIVQNSSVIMGIFLICEGLLAVCVQWVHPKLTTRSEQRNQQAPNAWLCIHLMLSDCSVYCVCVCFFFFFLFSFLTHSLCADQWNLRGGGVTGSLFHPCVNAMEWPYCRSRMEVSYCTLGFGAICAHNHYNIISRAISNMRARFAGKATHACLAGLDKK